MKNQSKSQDEFIDYREIRRDLTNYIEGQPPDGVGLVPPHISQVVQGIERIHLMDPNKPTNARWWDRQLQGKLDFCFSFQYGPDESEHRMGPVSGILDLRTNSVCPCVCHKLAFVTFYQVMPNGEFKQVPLVNGAPETLNLLLGKVQDINLED